jgi:GntR family transcriptional repressor for pyruvate dehydrogenase complex
MLAVFQDDIIKKAKLTDIVVQKIKTAIRNGELKSGDRIPSHDELCERWGISRTTIREALNKLESMGILTKYQGRGTYINEITAEKVIPANHVGSFLDRTAVLQLLEARKLVEPLIASLSAQRRTKAELLGLQKLLDELERANESNDHAHYSQADHEFHLLISRISKNPFLEVMMRNISAPLAVQQMEVISLKPEEQSRISAESQSLHQRIFEAIREANSQAAKESMERHLESIEKFMKRNL